MTFTEKVAKKCGTCGEVKESSAFGRETRSADGLRFRCRACRKRLETGDSEFWPNVALPSEPQQCWTWIGTKGRGGYGLMIVDGKPMRAHRYSWQLHFGETNGLDVCHHCDNPSCVKPSHLFLGTHTDNMRDMVRKGRCRYPTHCPSGHAYSPENTSTTRGYRRCKACDRAYMRRRKLQQQSKKEDIPASGAADLNTPWGLRS